MKFPKKYTSKLAPLALSGALALSACEAEIIPTNESGDHGHLDHQDTGGFGTPNVPNNGNDDHDNHQNDTGFEAPDTGGSDNSHDHNHDPSVPSNPSQPSGDIEDTCLDGIVEAQQDLIYQNLLPLLNAFSNPNQTPNSGSGNFIGGLGNTPFLLYEFGDPNNTIAIFGCNTDVGHITYVDDVGPFNEYAVDYIEQTGNLGIYLKNVDSQGNISGFWEIMEVNNQQISYGDTCDLNGQCDYRCEAPFNLSYQDLNAANQNIQTACNRLGEVGTNHDHSDHDH